MLSFIKGEFDWTCSWTDTLFARFFLIPEDELTYAARVVLGITAWTATWWVTEALPIPATSLLPIILLPTLGGLSMEQASRSYGDPIVFMYMGGFMIAIAIEKWKLHRRMALHILRVIGTRSDRIVLGVMIATAFYLCGFRMQRQH